MMQNTVSINFVASFVASFVDPPDHDKARDNDCDKALNPKHA
jgi:hypothetical protein